jgi:hypothetical protein
MSICLDKWWEFAIAGLIFFLPWFMFVTEAKKLKAMKYCWVKMSDFSVESLKDVENELSFSLGLDPKRHSYTLSERERLWGEIVDEHYRLQKSVGIRGSTLREPYRT